VALALLEQHWPSCPALEQELPPMDAQTALLSQALDDALAWRTHEGRPCGDCDQNSEDFCDRCAADWAQADRYHELARALGTVEDWSTIARTCGNTDPVGPAQ
jgi:hypothetical protein